MSGVGHQPWTPWAPLCWGCCICFHKALQVMLDLEPGSNLFASSGGMIFCTIHVFLHKSWGVSPLFFITAPQHHFLCKWSLPDHVDASCPSGFWNRQVCYKALQLLERWVCLLWQCLPKAQCRFSVLNLPISVTRCSASAETGRFRNLYEALRVGCHTGTEQDCGIFGLKWKSEKTSEIILEYAQQTAW